MIKGANYWQGINLAATKEYGGDRDRLNSELDQLVNMGVNNLRIICGSEGPDDQPYRMRPSLQPLPGQYNQGIFCGLDYLLDAMSKRNMTAVSECCFSCFYLLMHWVTDLYYIVTLSNFWHWSGG